MKITTVSYSDSFGGAARAAYRIHQALRQADVDSTMIVKHAKIGDWTIQRVQDSMASRLIDRLGGAISRRITRHANLAANSYHSLAIVPTALPQFFNNSTSDLVHLHWINNEMLSIRDIGKIRKPLIWTLHDQWAFCGTEHFSENLRFSNGYEEVDPYHNILGFDLSRWTWKRKARNWKFPISIVSPSKWLADQARRSTLMRNWPIDVIPNPIDIAAWQPMNSELAREILQLPQHVPIILFGAWNGTTDHGKGFDLLVNALRILVPKIPKLNLVIFGESSPKTPLNLGIQTHYIGRLSDSISLRILYCAADATVVPSRHESFGQTASESHACGTPVVAFNTSGLKDIVEHQQTGFLAEPFDALDLANGIEWTLSNQDRHKSISVNARRRAVENWSYEVVASAYRTRFEGILNSRVISF